VKTWPDIRLVAAAVSTRDTLRGRILPAVDRLRALTGANPEAGALLADIRQRAGEEADRLRLAIKNRGARTR
jgi:hypothetical protein